MSIRQVETKLDDPPWVRHASLKGRVNCLNPTSVMVGVVPLSSASQDMTGYGELDGSALSRTGGLKNQI